MDGENFFEETVADLGGMNTIITALNLMQTNKTIIDQSLPGLSQYTNEQMMLLRLSQVKKNFILIYGGSRRRKLTF